MCLSQWFFVSEVSERNEKRKKIVAYTVEKHEKTFLTQKNKKSKYLGSRRIFRERESREKRKKQIEYNS